MTLVINGRFLTRPMTGVDRAAFNLCLALDEIWPADLGQFIVAAPSEPLNPPPLRNGRVDPFGRLSGALWEQIELPRRYRDSLLLNPCNTAPLRHAKSITTIHDAHTFDFPESYSKPFVMWYRYLLPRIAKSAKQVTTVSKHAASRLAAHGIADATVIENGCDHFSGEPKPSGRTRPFVLFVGSAAKHKNVDMYLAVAERFLDRDLDFLVVGAGGSVFADGAASRTIPANVSSLGRIDDETLAGLYCDAEALLFPSRIEGFGLPPLEAQLLGCPVIASNRPPMTDLMADAAVFADPDDVDAWASALAALLDDGSWRADVASRGRASARRYTWERAARRYLDLIRDGLTTPAEAPSTAESTVS